MFGTLRPLFLVFLLAAAPSSSLAQPSGVVSLTVEGGTSALAVWNGQDETVRHVGPISTHTLPAGRHRLEVVPPRGATQALFVEVAAADTVRYHVTLNESDTYNGAFFEQYSGANALLIVPPEADVYYGDVRVSRGPLLAHVSPSGARVRVEGEGVTRSVWIRPDPEGRFAVRNVELYPPRQPQWLRYVPIPGVYQTSIERWYGIPLALGFGVTAGALIVADRDVRDDRRSYMLSAVGLGDPRFTVAIERARIERDRSVRTRNVIRGALAGLAALHVLDIAFRPYTGPYSERVDITPLLDPVSGAAGLKTVVSL